MFDDPKIPDYEKIHFLANVLIPSLETSLRVARLRLVRLQASPADMNPAAVIAAVEELLRTARL